MSPVAARIDLTGNPQDCLRLFAGFCFGPLNLALKMPNWDAVRKNVPSGFIPGLSVPAN